MFNLKAQNIGLYFIVLAAALFLFFAALGPGLYEKNTDVTFNEWQYRIFELLCHQDPVRSLTISETYMAVCSRCISIYSFFFIGWLSLPVFAKIKRTSGKSEMNWLIAAIILNLADVIGNYLGFWTNTHLSRFLLGSIFGLSLAFLLTNEFFNLNKS